MKHGEGSIKGAIYESVRQIDACLVNGRYESVPLIVAHMKAKAAPYLKGPWLEAYRKVPAEDDDVEIHLQYELERESIILDCLASFHIYAWPEKPVEDATDWAITA